MAKLVGVIRSDEYPFERRQLPLQCDDTLSMVIQFEDTCLGCTKEAMKQKELEYFVQKFHMLSNDDIAVALMVTSREMYSLLSQMVPCVGCRRSVERLFGQLVESGHPVLEPLIIAQNSVLSIKREYLFDPRALFALFYIHGSKLNSILGAIPKSKKNKRCGLHSLDSHTHKTRTLGIWMEVWELLSNECREEVVLIECDCLMETLENYLRKHRFCTECKSKVLRAYNILIGEVEAKQEKGYVASLFEGLRCCQGHIHVRSNTDFISHLITRAEPELMGSRRERHAKTLDIAQEEVLTCLGIHLYERLHKIWQKLKAEEQTWQMLFYLGVEALRKNFEVALENKRGISNLELLCEELLQEEQAKEQRREQKREKKKKKKNKKVPVKVGTVNIRQESEQRNSMEKDKENCLCDENTNLKNQMCNSCDDNHNTKEPVCEPLCTCDEEFTPKSKMKGLHNAARDNNSVRFNGAGSPSRKTTQNHHNSRPSCSPISISPCTDRNCGTSVMGRVSLNGARNSYSHPPNQHHVVYKQQSPVLLSRSASCRSDCGYSSGQEGCDNSSIPSSRDGSDIACSEGVCNHDGDSVLCHKEELEEMSMSCHGCHYSGSPIRNVQGDTSYSNESCFPVKVCGGDSSVKQNNRICKPVKTLTVDCQSGDTSSNFGLTLLDMLEDSCSGSEDEVLGPEISEEEIRDFRANQKLVNHQRCELRELLRQRFASLQMRLQPENSQAHHHLNSDK